MPAVIVVTVFPPAGEAVEPVKPAPIEIVLHSGYFKIQTPEPPYVFPEPPVSPSCFEPPPPPPVLAVPAIP